MLADALDFGRGCVPDLDHAVHMYELAARQGHAKAQARLGALMSEGRFLSGRDIKSDENAFVW